MVAYNKVPGAIEALLEAGVNFDSEAWAIALSNTAPSAPSFTPGTSDLSTGSGYTAGGNSAAVSSAAESGGTYKLILSDPATWNFTGAKTFRYAVLVNTANNIMVGYWDYGSSITTANGDTFSAGLDASNGVLQIT